MNERMMYWFNRAKALLGNLPDPDKIDDTTIKYGSYREFYVYENAFGNHTFNVVVILEILGFGVSDDGEEYFTIYLSLEHKRLKFKEDPDVWDVDFDYSYKG